MNAYQSKNKEIIESMSDEELKEVKALINAEQVKRIQAEIDNLTSMKP